MGDDHSIRARDAGDSDKGGSGGGGQEWTYLGYFDGRVRSPSDELDQGREIEGGFEIYTWETLKSSL